MEKQSHVTSIFRKGILTKENYTGIWIELITVLERGKGVKFSSHQ